MRKVHATKANLFGEWLYRIYVDGVKYDQFFSKVELTWSQLYDVSAGYAEGLDDARPV